MKNIVLARNSHQPTAAGAHLPESTALRSDKELDVLYSTAARFVSRAPCIFGHLRALASRPGEKRGLDKIRILSFWIMDFACGPSGFKVP